MMRKYKVLIVEDSKAYTKLLFSLLDVSESIQFETDTASSLEAAKLALKNELYDAIVLDLTLPDSPSDQTFSIISALVPETPIIISTGTGNEFALEALSRGAQDYLLKSGVNSDALCNSICYGIERVKIVQKAKERESLLHAKIRNLSKKLESANDKLRKLTEEIPNIDSIDENIIKKQSNLSKNKTMPILIVDDVEVNLIVTTKLLEMCGYTNIHLARNGEEAIQKWKQEKCELILMDIHMPLMDGITATSKIRTEQTNKAPCIYALSAGITDELTTTCMESGMDKIISKPVTHEKLRIIMSDFE